MTCDKNNNTLAINDAVRNLSNTIGFVTGFTANGEPILTDNRKARKNAPKWVADPMKCERIDVDALVAAGVVFECRGKYGYR